MNELTVGRIEQLTNEREAVRAISRDIAATGAALDKIIAERDTLKRQRDELVAENARLRESGNELHVAITSIKAIVFLNCDGKQYSRIGKAIEAWRSL